MSALLWQDASRSCLHCCGHSRVCQILLQIVMKVVITSSPPAWTSSAGMLLTPADFPFFSDCTAASTSLQRIGRSSSASNILKCPQTQRITCVAVYKYSSATGYPTNPARNTMNRSTSAYALPSQFIHS